MSAAPIHPVGTRVRWVVSGDVGVVVRVWTDGLPMMLVRTGKGEYLALRHMVRAA